MKNEKDEEIEPLIACVPMTHPLATLTVHGNRYTESTCDFCGTGVWLGERCKTMADMGVKKICPYCAATKRGMTKDSEIIVMDPRPYPRERP